MVEESIFELVQKLGFSDWELYRPIPAIDNKNPISRKDVKKLVDKLINLSERAGKKFNIVNGIPFCAYDMELVDRVSRGALPVDGHIRYAIDPRGHAKPDYYIDKNIGDPLDVLGCWNHPFMRKMRNLEFVPKECGDCKFLEKCRGGSRFSAMMANGDYRSKDPLMGE